MWAAWLPVLTRVGAGKSHPTGCNVWHLIQVIRFLHFSHVGVWPSRVLIRDR